MTKISVELSASYGYGCNGCGYGSEDTIEIEVNDVELAALKKLGKEEITAEDVEAAIAAGDITLESLHEQLSEKFYYMVEEYWLYDAYNECLEECLAEHIEQDISDGLYTPTASEDESADCDEEEDEEYDDEDDDWDDDEENDYDLDAYYDWVKEHDHEFVAERVGLDLDACRDDAVNYTITIN